MVMSKIWARVSSTCLVSVQRNRYSVPCRLTNHKIAVHLYPDRIEAYVENMLVACHARLFDRDQTSYDGQHYIPLIDRKPGALRNGAPFAEMPTPFVMLAAALRRRERNLEVIGSWPKCLPPSRPMALKLFWWRWNWCWSGVHSAEHVLNDLARLNQEGMPAQVETSLMLTEDPLANTARYDSLNAKEVSHV